MIQVDVIYRATDAVNCYSGRDRNGGDKLSVITKCFKSFENELNIVNNFTAVLDRPSKELQELFKDYNIVLPDAPGNGQSFITCLDIAFKSKADYIFFLEDDYFFYEKGFTNFINFVHIMAGLGYKTFSAYPTDYPDRYINRISEPCNIVLGPERHWRTINKTTCTFLSHIDILTENYSALYSFIGYGIVPGISEDTTINQLYRKYPCYSPMPSLAEHYQYQHTLSPYSKI